MRIRVKVLGISVAVTVLSFTAICPASEKDGARAGKAEIAHSAPPALWRSPADVASRDLFYGPGGKEHEPHSTFTFLKEDLEGTNPKFVVRDQDGTKWKVKLGAEARPETVASRLTWAVGYFTNEDYFLQDLQVRDMPAHLHRGQKMVASDGLVHNVRLKRYLEGEKKIGDWRWRQDPFSGTRELNGLRVMMVLINNWDLKDDNNSVYEEADGGGPGDPVEIYMVSDLGSSFGTEGLSCPPGKAKGNLKAYSRTKFVSKITPDYVDFNVPARPALVYVFKPWEFFGRIRLCWIGKHIPRDDARWIGQLLAQLSGKQIRDAFQAAGYSAQEVEGFSVVVENRIAELNKL
jgi:hypothetical protein